MGHASDGGREMNHDATHCFDCTSLCPRTCYRAQLTRHLREIIYMLPTSWAHFKGTKECPKWPHEPKEALVHD